MESGRNESTRSLCCYWLSCTNKFFKKRNSQLVTYNSGGCATQIDYILVRRTELKHVKNVKVIRNEECIPQHELLVGVLKIQTPSDKPRFITIKRKLWRVHKPEVQAEYQSFIKDVKPSCVEDVWNNLKDCLVSGVDKVCSKTKGGWVHNNKTWWWNNVVNDVVNEKPKKWKQRKLGESKEEYQLAKKAANCTVYDGKQQAQLKYFQDINTNNTITEMTGLENIPRNSGSKNKCGQD